MKKKTHEEYVNQVADINPNIEVVDSYINNNTKILHRCKVCGNEWLVVPSSIVQGRGCPECGRQNTIASRRKTHEQYISQVASINPQIEVIGDYVNDGTKILHHCKRCGYDWMATPGSIIAGTGCPMCGIKSRAMKSTRTNEEFIQLVQEINPNIEIITPYIKSELKISCKCLIDGYVWETLPANLLKGHGCPECARAKSKIAKTRTHEEYLQLVNSINPNIEVIEQYIDGSTKILHRCKIDGYEWKALPNNVIRGHGCPMYAGILQTTSEQYIQRLNLVNPDVESLSGYINLQTKILHRCKKCGHEWEATPANILRGKGCPHCASSKGEKVIKKYLESKNILFDPQYTFQDCKNVHPLRFDFYLPDYNACIEFNGQQHYEAIDFFGGEKALYITIKRDNIKINYCREHNIPLLIIRYDEDIDQKLDEFLGTLTIQNY